MYLKNFSTPQLHTVVCTKLWPDQDMPRMNVWKTLTEPIQSKLLVLKYGPYALHRKKKNVDQCYRKFKIIFTECKELVT